MSQPTGSTTTTGSLRAVAATERDERRVLVIARDYAQAATWARDAGITGARFLWVQDSRHLDVWTPRQATIRALDVPMVGWTPALRELLAARLAQGMAIDGAPSVIAALTAPASPAEVAADAQRREALRGLPWL